MAGKRLNDEPARSSKDIKIVNPDPTGPADDRLCGVGQIAAFWFKKDSQAKRKSIYRMLEAGELPAGKFLGRWVASRKRLMQFHEELTSGNFRDAAE
jgi:hypothetical protein